MHADSGQQLRQPVSAQGQKQEAAEQVRHVDPFGAAERQQVSHRGKQDPRIAQRRVGNGVAYIAAVEGIVRHVVIALPIVAAAMGEDVDVLGGQARRKRELRPVAKERRQVIAVIEVDREQLPVQTERAALPRGGHRTAFHLGPGMNLLMKFVSKRPERKSASARMRCCMGIDVWMPSTINMLSARCMRRMASPRSLPYAISLATSES